MTAALTIRALRAADIPVLAGVLARAYQSQQDFHWRLDSYLTMRAMATFVAEYEGKPIGMVVGHDYGPTAYVSQMAVDPPKQRRGTATALMDALIVWANGHDFRAVELDATPAGAALYTRYGFLTNAQTLVYDATDDDGGDVRCARRYTAREREDVLKIDAWAFGADRSNVLRLVLDSPRNAVFVIGATGGADGYAVAQMRSGLLGPIVARSRAAAAALLDAARSQLTTHHVSIPSDNCDAQALLLERGYRFARPLAHMVRGTPPVAARDALYARINLGQG